MDDNLDRAQRLVDDPTADGGARLLTAAALALIDLARSLRGIETALGRMPEVL